MAGGGDVGASGMTPIDPSSLGMMGNMSGFQQMPSSAGYAQGLGGFSPTGMYQGAIGSPVQANFGPSTYDTKVTPALKAAAGFAQAFQHQQQQAQAGMRAGGGGGGAGHGMLGQAGALPQAPGPVVPSAAPMGLMGGMAPRQQMQPITPAAINNMLAARGGGLLGGMGYG